MVAISGWLDLTWLTVAIVWVVCLFAFEFRQRQKKGRPPRALGILLSLVVLFPCFSASDDLMGFALLAPRPDHEDEMNILSTSDFWEISDFELGARQLELNPFRGAEPLDPVPPPFYFTAWVPLVAPVIAGHTPPHQASRPPPSVPFSL